MILLFIVALIIGAVIGGVATAIYYEIKNKVQFIEPSDKEYEVVSDLVGDGERTQFIDSVSPKERFNAAKNVSDLIQ